MSARSFRFCAFSPGVRWRSGSAGAMAGACALSLALTGCSGLQDAQSAGGTTTAQGPIVQEASQGEPGRQTAISGVSDLKDPVCTANAAGSWTFTGTLHNGSATTSHYSLTVSVASRETGAVFGTSSQSYAVKPGRDLRVSMTRIANSKGAPEGSVSCGHLITVVRDS